MLRIFADDAHDAPAVDHLAFIAHFLYRRTDFHSYYSLFLVVKIPDPYWIPGPLTRNRDQKPIYTDKLFARVLGRTATTQPKPYLPEGCG